MRRIVVVGGGPGGVFAAIACAAADPRAKITVLERSPQILAKVLISGGGRCNVTHANFEPRDLASNYPRGERALIGAFHRFQPKDTIAWFENNGVQLKTEEDGRIFPISDCSASIADCLLKSAVTRGIELRSRVTVQEAAVRPQGGFALQLSDGQSVSCDRLLLATGGCRTASAGKLAVSLGHTLEQPVPSLFSLHVADRLLEGLAGVSLQAEVRVPETGLRQQGPVLVTHWGLSGPAILRLSAWGARELHARNYRFPLRVNWAPRLEEVVVDSELESVQARLGKRILAKTPVLQIPSRLWGRLTGAAGIGADARWQSLSRAARCSLVRQICRTELFVSGKSLNKEEFVTCGGARLDQVDFRTMQSRITPGLFFAGELLDIDGITGGYNFQAAWTTGWIAGNAMAE